MKFLKILLLISSFIYAGGIAGNPPGHFAIKLFTPMICTDTDNPATCNYIAVSPDSVGITIYVNHATQKNPDNPEVGIPLENTTITLTLNGPTNLDASLSTSTVTTNENGEATATLYTGANGLGSHTILAKVPDGRLSTMELNISSELPPAPSSIYISSLILEGKNVSITQEKSSLYTYPGTEPIKIVMRINSSSILPAANVLAKIEFAPGVFTTSKLGPPEKLTSTGDGIVYRTFYPSQPNQVIEFMAWSPSADTMREFISCYVGQPGTAEIKVNTAIKNKIEHEGIYPNPLNPKQVKANIRYNLSAKTRVKIQVVTLAGKLVWSKETQSNKGGNKILWNGKNNKGQTVSNGIYLVRISPKGQKVKSFSFAVFGR